MQAKSFVSFGLWHSEAEWDERFGQLESADFEADPLLHLNQEPRLNAVRICCDCDRVGQLATFFV